MGYKAAVASSDGKVVNQHFGRAKQFLIFSIEGDVFRFLEIRENIPACGTMEHSPNGLAETIDLISDCRVVLVCRIGPAAEQQLMDRGIRSYMSGDFIEDALKEIIHILGEEAANEY